MKNQLIFMTTITCLRCLVLIKAKTQRHSLIRSSYAFNQLLDRH